MSPDEALVVMFLLRNGVWLSGAAQESNLPSVGLRRRTGFEVARRVALRHPRVDTYTRRDVRPGLRSATEGETEHVLNRELIGCEPLSLASRLSRLRFRDNATWGCGRP
jgi:hypothetical protein